jgi:hypothetical protein
VRNNHSARIAARYPEFATYARETSIHAAAEHFGVSRTPIQRAMRAAKIPSRRPGNYTNAEISAMKRAA